MEDGGIRFRGPYPLEHFTSIKEWNNGYLVVMAKYSHSKEPIEECIDLASILEDMAMDAQKILSPIKEVRVGKGQQQKELGRADIVVSWGSEDDAT